MLRLSFCWTTWAALVGGKKTKRAKRWIQLIKVESICGNNYMFVRIRISVESWNDSISNAFIMASLWANVIIKMLQEKSKLIESEKVAIIVMCKGEEK